VAKKEEPEFSSFSTRFSQTLRYNTQFRKVKGSIGTMVPRTHEGLLHLKLIVTKTISYRYRVPPSHGLLKYPLLSLSWLKRSFCRKPGLLFFFDLALKTANVLLEILSAAGINFGFSNFVCDIRSALTKDSLH
jgi:hypothetical protein